MRARSATFCKRRLTTEKFSCVVCSRTKAFTVRCPETVSSIMPFSSPSVFCVSRKPLRVRLAIKRVSTKVSGMTIRLTMVIGTFSMNMMITTPISPKNAGDQLAEAGGQNIADIFHIVGQAAHQVAVGALVEEAQRQGLHAGEQVLAQIAHHALRHPGHDIGLQPGARRRDDIGSDHQPDQTRPGPGRSPRLIKWSIARPIR